MRESSTHRWLAAACGLLLLALPGCSRGPEPADLVLIGGKIVTVDADQPEAAALAARDGLIVAVGDEEEITALRGPETRVIDLGGRLAIPGFIEGHAHFTGIGRALVNVDLRGARDWPEVVQRVASAAEQREPGEWILGRGWHQEKWETAPQRGVEGYPTHDLLSRAVPDHPVFLTHASGHASIANARAMELAGLDRNTSDPPGGAILRDVRGEPTGVFIELAENLVHETYEAVQLGLTPVEIDAQERRVIELADRECLSKGVTSFQDAGSRFETVDRFRRMAEAGELGVRLWVMLIEENDALEARIDEYRVQDAGDHHLTVRAIKRLIDGALGSRGAWLLEPYTDLPGSHGHNTIPLDELERTARIAARHGFQLCVHAIGDRGNRETLDLYERIFAEQPGAADLRWRIEHAQHLHPDDVPRFAELGVIASMQGIHCTSDGPWVPVRLGADRARSGAYVWRDLIESGAIVSNGTDAPVEDVDPIRNFHALVTRRMADGEAFHPRQRMTRQEALAASTINAAYAAFEDGIKGSLTRGKLADITVLSQDIMTVPDDRILETEVLYTIVGGEVLYTHPDL
jgi:predicted amidohydrolase YtcJ